MTDQDERKLAQDSKPALEAGDAEHIEHGDKATGVVCTAEDDRRIRKRMDTFLLPVLMIIYFLQIADKTIIGLTAVYGLRDDANLVGNQYSTIGAIGYYAQLGAQPLAAWLLVKLRYSLCMFCALFSRICTDGLMQVMPAIVILWSASLLGMAGSESFPALAACRFLLGW